MGAPAQFLKTRMQNHNHKITSAKIVGTRGNPQSPSWHSAMVVCYGNQLDSGDGTRVFLVKTMVI